MDAIKLLEKQHRKVETLFRKLGKKGAPTKTLLSELANDLVAHMAIEQDIFYPAVRSVDASLVLESFEEHALAELALKRLLATNPRDEAFKARVTALKELIEHHVEEEEEELFPKVKKALGDERLKQLGKRMAERFDERVKTGFRLVLPRGFATTSSDRAHRLLNRTAAKSARAA